MATWAPTVDASWGTGDCTPAVDDDASSADCSEVVTPEPEKERKERLYRKDIEELQTARQNGKEKFITIYARAGRDKPLTEFYPNFPRGAAALFSKVWTKQLEGTGGCIIIDPRHIEGGDLEPYKRILEWVQLCVDEGNDVKFPEITECSDPLFLLIEIIKLANSLEIPEASLQEQLKKAAIKYARHSLIDIAHVELIYDEGVKGYLGDSEGLREAAAASIFEAWWKFTLDAPEYDGYCSFIEQLRAEFPKLDEDINKRFDDKKEFIEAKRAEKRENQRQSRADGGGGRGNGSHSSTAADYPEATGADGGWGDAAAAVGAEPASFEEVAEAQAILW